MFCVFVCVCVACFLSGGEEERWRDSKRVREGERQSSNSE
jgi:hypothetical protein